VKNDELRVGVFDSGLGGLTVVREIQNTIKGAKLFYIADTKNAPYGEKTSEQILQFSLHIAEYLLHKHKIDALIIACNTATSVAIKTLRERYPELIIIGTEPGIKPAIEYTQTGKIAVLATPATLDGDKYQALANTLTSQKNVDIYAQACPGLVEQIEKGKAYSAKTKQLLETWLVPMRDKKVDTIVLGCTHYPLVAQSIKEIMHYDVRLVDTAAAIAKYLIELSRKKGHKNQGKMTTYLYSTGKINQKTLDSIIDKYESLEIISIPHTL